jgi:hypothetical protein
MGGPDQMRRGSDTLITGGLLDAAVKPGLADEELAAIGNDFKSPDSA